MPGSQSTLQAFTNTFPTLPEMEVSSLFPAHVFNWKCHSMCMETEMKIRSHLSALCKPETGNNYLVNTRPYLRKSGEQLAQLTGSPAHQPRNSL